MRKIYQSKVVLAALLIMVLPFAILAGDSSRKKSKKKKKSKTEQLAAEKEMQHRLDSLSKVVEQLQKPVSTGTSPAEEAYADTVIQWNTIEKGMKLQTQNHKKVLVYVHAKWCKWCKLSDDSVFTNKEIAHYINQQYNPVFLNCEDPQPLFFKGQQFNFLSDPKKNVNELALYFLNNKQTYPGYVIIDSDGSILNSETGYMEPAYMEMYLNYYATNAYVNSDIEHFDKSFKGKIKY
ncbi:MAG: thioredoxin family protein [Chitinophagales bacterium]